MMFHIVSCFEGRAVSSLGLARILAREPRVLKSSAFQKLALIGDVISLAQFFSEARTITKMSKIKK